MRIGNAYRIVEKMNYKDKRYHKLISKIESNIEYQKRLSYGTFLAPYINFTLRTKVELSKAELKALRIYLNDKYFDYTREYKLSIECKKRLFCSVYIVKLV